MSLAFGAMQPLAVAAAALSHGLLVAAAGVVVVVAIVLVFVMVLRGAGSSRRNASGLGFDPRDGQVGQPHNPASDAGQAGPWNDGRSGDPYGAADQGAYGRGAYGQQPNGGFDQGAYGQQPGWGAPAGGQPQWNEPAPGVGQAPSQNDWGAPQPAANPWNAPAGGGQQWNNAPAATRPGASDGHPWDAPQQPQPASAWDAQPQQPQQPPAWDAQPQQPPAWDAQPQQPPAWDVPQQPQSAPAWGQQQPVPQPQSQGGWNPQQPSQPSWGQQPVPQPQSQAGWPPQQPSQPAWNQQPDPMAQPTVQRGGSRGGGPRLSERKPDGTGREFDLRKERLTIGRHRDSDVFLEDLAVSRLNTTISHDPSGAFILKDENSANGTYVNGERVTEHTLQDGDEVQVGQTTLIFHQ